MTPHANTARWRPRAKNRWIALGCKAFLLLAGILLAAQYLAGFLFLQWVRSDPRTATPLTVARYGYYFSERADIRVPSPASTPRVRNSRSSSWFCS